MIVGIYSFDILWFSLASTDEGSTFDQKYILKAFRKLISVQQAVGTHWININKNGPQQGGT